RGSFRRSVLCQRIAVRPVIGGIDIVRIAERTRAVQLQKNKTGSALSEPRLSEIGFFAHQPCDTAVAGVERANADPQRIAARVLGFVIAREDDACAQEDWPTVKLAQKFRLNFDEFDLLRVRAQLFWRNLLVQFEFVSPAAFQMKLLWRAVEIAGRFRRAQVAV